jgi:hypothetical protein
MHPLKLRKLMIEAAKPHWEAAAAAAAALGGTALQASAADRAKREAAASSAMPKGGAQQGGTVASQFALKKPGDLGLGGIGGMSTQGLGEMPKGQDVADVYRISDALKETDLSSGAGAPPSIPGGGVRTVDNTTTNSGSMTQQGGGQGGSLSDTLSTAQTAGQLGSLAANALRPSAPQGMLPQPGQPAGAPTANAAQERLKQLIAMRAGFGTRGF